MSTFYRPVWLPLTELWIETGTQRGDSLAAALAIGYPHCLSVEFVKSLHNYSSKRFGGESRVQLFHGSSPDILPQMIDPAKTTTFWLDAHYSGDNISWQDPKCGECPLLQELKVILAVSWNKSPIICIDDAFMFKPDNWNTLSPPFTKAHWPDLSEIAMMLSGYRLTEENAVFFWQQKD